MTRARHISIAGLVLLGLVGIATPALAQPVSATITMRADRNQVEPGERFQLVVSARVRGAGRSQVTLPDLSAFGVVSRQVHNPVQIIGLGGAQQIDSTTTHTLVLVARQPGTYRLTPAAVLVNGQRFESSDLVITVGDGGPNAPDAPQLPPPPPAPPGDVVDAYQVVPEGFIRTVAHRGTPYVRQQATVTIYLYLPGQLRGNPTPTQEPSTEGFWVQDLLQPQRRIQGEQEYFEGQYWNVYVMRRFAAFPLQAGELTIGGTEITLRSARSLFSVFGGQEPEPQVFRGPPLTMHVRELPAEGRPAGDLHVGELTLEAELSPNQVPTGDAVTLTLTATGRGVMQQLPTPRPRGANLRVLDPDIRDSFGFPNDVAGGTRVLRFLVIPEREGEYTLGPFEIPFFNPHTEQYGVARTAALRLTAAGNPITPVATDDAANGADDTTERAGPDFGPIHTESELSRGSAGRSVHRDWLASFAVWPLIFLSALGIRFAQKRGERDDPSQAARRARKLAKKNLRAAREHKRAEEPRKFYASIAQALKGVLEGQLGHPVGSLTHRELGQTLRERGMDDELANTIVEELEGCDFARFSAAGSGEGEMASCLSRAEGLIASISKFEPTEEET